MREFDVAEVAHFTPTRLRLRVPGRRHDAAFFAKIVQEIESKWALIRAEANPLTGSVTLSSRHRLDWSSVDLATYGLAVVNATADQTPAQALAVSLPASSGVPATRVHFRTAPTSADAGLATLGVQLVSALLSGRPLAALLQWVTERLLQSLLSHLLVSQGLRA
jgi:hypothetical protein